MTEREQRLWLEITKQRAALRALVEVTDKTARLLEENCEALKECGYWNIDEKKAFERAKLLGCEDRQIIGVDE